VDTILVAAGFLALGLVIGFGAGAQRMRAAIEQGQIVRRTAAGVARVFAETPPTRTAADVFAGRIRVVLGGITYELPVRSRADNRRWVAALDLRLSTIVSAIDAARANPGELLPILVAEADALYQLVKSYDSADVLPPVEGIDEIASDAEIVRAALEVWQAANPKAAIAATSMATSGNSPARSNGSPASTAGAPTTSSTA
jgi:hypothetical protein